MQATKVIAKQRRSVRASRPELGHTKQRIPRKALRDSRLLSQLTTNPTDAPSLDLSLSLKKDRFIIEPRQK